MIALKNVLVATDFSEPCQAALTYGRELAGSFGARLHVLHVVQNLYVSTFGASNCAALAPDRQKQIEQGARGRLDTWLATNEGRDVATLPVVMTSPSPACTIVDYAADHDINLIVMGTHGRSGLSHLVMGSTAEQVVRLAGCPVLTVRPAERGFIVPDIPVAAVSPHDDHASSVA